jgi:hypothetical protein
VTTNWRQYTLGTRDCFVDRNNLLNVPPSDLAIFEADCWGTELHTMQLIRPITYRIYLVFMLPVFYLRRAPSRLAIRGMSHLSPPSYPSVNQTNQEERTNENFISFPLLFSLQVLDVCINMSPSSSTACGMRVRDSCLHVL